MENEEKQVKNEIVIRKGELAVPHWMQARQLALQAAETITAIETDLDYGQAGEAINAFSHLIKDLEVERKKLTAPIDAVKKEIMAQEKELAAPMAAEQNRLRALANAYATKKAAEREAALKAAQEAAAEAAARRAAMEEEAAQAFGGASVVPEPAEGQAVAPFVPEAAPKSASIRQVAVYTYEIVDASKLDRKFLSVDESKIRAFCNYLKQMGVDPATVEEPGLVIKKEIRIDSK